MIEQPQIGAEEILLSNIRHSLTELFLLWLASSSLLAMAAYSRNSLPD